MKIIHNPKFPICERAQRVHDVLMVSSFALWAMVLGFRAGLHLSHAGELKEDGRRLPWLIRGSTCGQMRAKSRPGF